MKNLEFYNINLKINCKYAYLAVSETLPEKNIIYSIYSRESRLF